MLTSTDATVCWGGQIGNIYCSKGQSSFIHDTGIELKITNCKIITCPYIYILFICIFIYLYACTETHTSFQRWASSNTLANWCFFHLSVKVQFQRHFLAARNWHDFNMLKSPVHLTCKNTAHQPASCMLFSPCSSSHNRSLYPLVIFQFFTAWLKPCSHTDTHVRHFHKFTILLHSDLALS